MHPEISQHVTAYFAILQSVSDKIATFRQKKVSNYVGFIY